MRERRDAPVPGVDTGSTVDARFETVWTLDDCREAVESLRRAVDGPLVRAGMDAERVRALRASTSTAPWGCWMRPCSRRRPTRRRRSWTGRRGWCRVGAGGPPWSRSATPPPRPPATGAPRPDGPSTGCSAAAGNGRSGQRAPLPCCPCRTSRGASVRRGRAPVAWGPRQDGRDRAGAGRAATGRSRRPPSWGRGARSWAPTPCGRARARRRRGPDQPRPLLPPLDRVRSLPPQPAGPPGARRRWVAVAVVVRSPGRAARRMTDLHDTGAPGAHA